VHSNLGNNSGATLFRRALDLLTFFTLYISWQIMDLLRSTPSKSLKKNFSLLMTTIWYRNNFTGVMAENIEQQLHRFLQLIPLQLEHGMHNLTIIQMV
jgi:hypothetical protein